MKFKYLFLLFILLVAVSLPLAKADISLPKMDISGPEVIGTSQEFQYTIEFNASGYESCGYSVILAGNDLSGASPLTETIENSTTNRIFVLNLTAPDSAQDLYLYIDGYGMLNGERIEAEYQIVKMRVIEPIIFGVNVTNNANIVLEDIPVNFYVDDKYIGNTTIDRLNPQENERVEYVWTFDSLGNGEHKLTIELMNEYLVFDDTGNQEYTQVFYYGTEESDFTWIFYIMIIVVVGMFFLLIMNRKDTKKTTPKWKK